MNPTAPSQPLRNAIRARRLEIPAFVARERAIRARRASAHLPPVSRPEEADAADLLAVELGQGLGQDQQAQQLPIP